MTASIPLRIIALGLATLVGCTTSSPADVDDGGTTPRVDTGPGSMFPDAGHVGSTDVDSPLPPLPEIEHVVGVVTGDGVTVSLQPIDGARDYRIYELPDPSRVHVETDGAVTVDDALYRCAGDRNTYPATPEGAEDTVGTWVHTTVEGTVAGTTRTLAGASLGYVYLEPGPDRVPVYALGDPAPTADSACGSGWWSTTRSKIYTTDEAERTRLLAQSWRDDGIAFYAPTSGASILHADDGAGEPEVQRLYYPSASAEAGERSGLSSSPAFFVSPTGGPGLHELMRVNVSTCTDFMYPSHDELVVGRTFFERARYQGADVPEHRLHWSGLTGRTTLVIEALDEGCPYQGRIGPVHLDERTHVHTTTEWTHDPTLTIDEVRATAPNGEVYLNGQHDGANRPRAIARSYIVVEPAPAEPMDWSDTFAPGASMAPFTYRPCTVPNHMCYQMFEASSSDYELLWHTIEDDSYGLATVNGELWVSFTDHAADTNGKFRLEPREHGEVVAGSFFHVTMSASTVSTGRRYPQILVSDGPSPITYSMPEHRTIVLQPRWESPNMTLQVCDYRVWDVNNQCNGYQMNVVRDAEGLPVRLAPVMPPIEHFHPDVLTRYDLYLSTTRAYVFLDRTPFGCVDLPVGIVPSGEVTVAFASVLYHSEADEPLGFTGRAYPRETQVHYDDLGFSSHVAPPVWDEARFPCVPADQIIGGEEL